MALAKKLLHTRYRVNDLEQTVEFYKNVLGLEEVRRHKSPRGSELAFLKAPESEETVEIVRTGMRLCIEKGPPAPTGTGRLAQVPGIDLIGKTGSAQVTSLEVHEQYATEADIPYKFRDHAWFVAGVLDQEPKSSICILIEHGHHGSSAAAPLAKKIVEFFYEKKDTSSVQLASQGIAN